MKYTVGDKILMLHSKEEGTVVDIINDKMVMVEVGGTSFPVYLDQIDFPYFHRFTQKKAPMPAKRTPGEEIRREKPTGPQRPEKGMFLTMLPVFESDGYDEVVSTLKFHLLNETNSIYAFHFEIWLGNSLFLEIKQEIHPFQHTYLADLDFDQLNDNPRLEFTFSPKNGDLTLAATFQKTWKAKAKQLFQQLGELQQKQQATINYTLFEKYPLRAETDAYGFSPIEKKKLSTLTSKQSIKDTTPITAKLEVDLHIEKLTSDWKGLSNLEMLGIQLNEFQHQLDLAISQRQHKLIVIHGIGSGMRMYGPLYNSSLVNRVLDANRPVKAVNPSTFKLFFAVADTVLNTNTSLIYRDSQQQMRTININAKTDSAVLEMAPAGTKVAIRSSYVPVRNGIDTFMVTYSDTLNLK